MKEVLLGLELNIFNGINQQLVHPYLDPLMRLLSNEVVWVVTAVIFILAGFIRNRRRFGWVCSGLILSVACSDLLAYRLLKPSIDRSRPCYSHKVRLVADGCGSTYGFPSNHASNAMATATILFLFYRRRRFTRWLFLLAALVGYSRIYLGVHYPGDILAGFLLGALVAIAGFWGLNWGRQKFGAAAFT